MKFIGIFFLFLITQPCFSQQDSVALTQRFWEFRKLQESMKFEKSFPYYDENFLKDVPTSMILKMFDKALHNEKFKVSVSNTQLKELAPIIVTDSIRYC
jgi:hypothetical protein